MLELGTKAPAFELPDQNGEIDVYKRQEQNGRYVRFYAYRLSFALQNFVICHVQCGLVLRPCPRCCRLWKICTTELSLIHI